MSSRYQAGIVLPGYNALKVANAPTIGTATVASGTSVSVTFTAPSCVGGGAISSYSAYCTTTGTNITTGASSPLTVTGLTTGNAYTFKVIATNVYGPSYPSAASNSATPVAIGQQAYTTSGTYTWVAPAGVTSISAVAVGGGGTYGYTSTPGCRFSGGGGGALAYRNNITVVPGNSYTVLVGASAPYNPPGGSGGNSTFNSTTLGAGGGVGGSGLTGGAGGSVLNGTGGAGGSGGSTTIGAIRYPGGGGAGGYSGAGGAGGCGNLTSAGACGSAGSGGGGGGGAGYTYGGSGGGVGILGQGSNGSGGTSGSPFGTAGSGGSGRLYGGGYGPCCSGSAGVGAVRIIWPGTSRSFPSTCTGNL